MREFPRVQVESRQQWRAWLASHHAASGTIWLVTFKKAAGERYLPYDAIVEEALCFGWVDGQTRRLDELRSMLLLSKRKRGSAWSGANKRRIASLEAAGQMEAAGREAVESAKADGSWVFLDDVEALIEPPDLREALDGTPHARPAWEGFPKSVKKPTLEWIKRAKKPETRARRIAETAEKSAQGIRPR